MDHDAVYRKLYIVLGGIVCGLLLIFLILPTLVQAQTGDDFDLNWSTIDSGSKVSSGGDFYLGGTVGQADANQMDTMSGGEFEMSGGFWKIKELYPLAIQLDVFSATTQQNISALSFLFFGTLFMTVMIVWQYWRRRA